MRAPQLTDCILPQKGMKYEVQDKGFAESAINGETGTEGIDFGERQNTRKLARYSEIAALLKFIQTTEVSFKFGQEENDEKQCRPEVSQGAASILEIVQVGMKGAKRFVQLNEGGRTMIINFEEGSKRSSAK